MAVRVEDDYSDVLVYLCNLFSIKRVPSITVDRYRIDFGSFSYAESGNLAVTDFPERGSAERISRINLLVTSETFPGEVKVEFAWDHADFAGDIDRKAATEFLDVLDRSTFRYF